VDRLLSIARIRPFSVTAPTVVSVTRNRCDDAGEGTWSGQTYPADALVGGIGDEEISAAVDRNALRRIQFRRG
jgi:hypothetical protein